MGFYVQGCLNELLERLEEEAGFWMLFCEWVDASKKKNDIREVHHTTANYPSSLNHGSQKLGRSISSCSSKRAISTSMIMGERVTSRETNAMFVKKLKT